MLIKKGHGLFREPKALDPLQGQDTLRPASQANHGLMEILAPPGDECGHNLPTGHQEGAPVGKRGAPPSCRSGPRVVGEGGELRPDQIAGARRPTAQVHSRCFCELFPTSSQSSTCQSPKSYFGSI